MIARIINDNKIEVYSLSQFDIAAIMHSGQVFRYYKTERGYAVISAQNHAEVFQLRDRAVISCSNAEYFWRYFDLDTDYDTIKDKLYRYDSIRPAISAGGGIRILRADFVETVISFIISANNNIKRFTKTLNALAEGFGNRLFDGVYAFPTLAQLSCVSEADFTVLGCGYRAPYLVKTVQRLADMEVSTLAALDNKTLDTTLQTLAGVGAKVSACIMLFAGDLHRLSVCPIDTWLKKALLTIAEKDREALLSHPHAGIAQQYIFHYLQHLGKKL